MAAANRGAEEGVSIVLVDNKKIISTKITGIRRFFL